MSRVDEILSWYDSDAPGVQRNLRWILESGKLAGTGKLVLLPVDQGFEHGPTSSFGPNPAAYDPHYHFRLAIDAGCSAYAAPLGSLQAGAREFAGQIPTILKLNSSDSLFSGDDPKPAVTGSVSEALRLGCAAVGFTIYPGSAARNEMYAELREIAEQARAVGLAVVGWSYPQGSALSSAGETALDIVAYAAQIAAQLGAHIIKVKPPSAHIERADALAVFEEQSVPIDTLEDRVRHVVQSAFNGRRIVIFSGGATKSSEEVLSEITSLAAGGAFGSILGRNTFQRPRDEAIALLDAVMQTYRRAA